ncbi:DUF2637 domain-containing protein [Micromonospora orduensis]|uniref:DUF2637 domain-containing protein n=1 Tax=Micromonospora orduensis TaxID=1420891 RepID=A0A5C4QS97_9ACTN|nr:DUF2637 domain-containing protein [Micromonospora orduensis]TNH29845.1 DUF2637 domain-containing protein [Micromonospora orduensis]
MTATAPPQQSTARTSQAAEVDIQLLTRLRWGVRAVLTLGVAASIAANVLHAQPNLISQVIAAWPPLALLLTVELISRVPADRRGLAAARLIAAAVIAGIAAWVSYWHMVGVAARYGETDAAASYLLPISVDGLVVVASISLVEIAGRIRAPSVSPAHASTDAGDAEEVAPARPRNDAHDRGTGPSHRDTDRPGRNRSRITGPSVAPVENSDEQDKVKTPGVTQQIEPDPFGGQRHEPEPDGLESSAKVPSDTAGAVAYWYSQDPSLHPADIATRIGRSERTVRRYWPPVPRTANGHDTSRAAEQVRLS